MNYVIEKNIPMEGPKPAPGKHRKQREKKYPFHLMEIGDSVVLPIVARTSANSEPKRTGRRFEHRLLPDGMCRIWRIE